jgi:hypothetical protein
MAEEKKQETPAPEQPAAQPAAAAPAAPAAAPAKKSHTVLIVVLVLLFVFIVLPGLIFGIGGAIIGHQINSFFKKANNGQVEVNVGGQKVGVNTSENQAWPTSAPSSVPKLTSGKITTSAHIGDTWSVSATNVTAADYTKYVNNLTAANYVMQQEVEINGLKSISGTKNGYQVSVTYTPASEGSESEIMVAIAKETPTSSNYNLSKKSQTRLFFDS